MAIYHLNMGHVSRSSGRSCVQSVAYITRSCLEEERRGITADYRSRDADVFWETLAPEGSGIDKKDLTIWNKLESYEDEYAQKRYKDVDARIKYQGHARTAQTYVYALPRELTLEQNIGLIREIVKERFVDRGLVSTYGIHWEEGNPHVHIQVSERAIEKDGTFSYFKVARELSTPKALRETRKFFSDKTNELFESLGMEVRVDYRSFIERGLDLIPTVHKGWLAHQLDKFGLFTRIGKDNTEISEENKERISREPSIILNELTSKQATFSEMDVIGLAQRRLKDDASILAEYVIHAVLKEAVEVGKGMDDQIRYTSQEYFDKEARILESFERYQQNKTAITIDPSKVEELLGKFQEQSKVTGFKPTEGQVNGIRTLCGDSQISVMVGRAGTGKTTTMKSVVQLHEDAGYTVLGMAPSATAAAQLEADTGCPCDTIAHYAYFWRMYHEAVEGLKSATTNEEREAVQKDIDKYSRHLPNEKTMIMIDEAGMVAIGDWKGNSSNKNIADGWDAITKTIDLTGAKLILTGDDHQYKPIGSGDAFRRFVHELRGTKQLCELTEIKRQNIPWMREASSQLAEHNTGTALEMYERQGHVQEHASNVDVYEDMARQYLRNVMSQPDSDGMVIVATNEERHALNREIRSLLKENGLLPKEDLLQRGEDGYAIGDKIIFTTNDRGGNTSFDSKDKNFFVRNNMEAVIQEINPVRIKDPETGEVEETYKIVAYVPDHKATVKFNLNEYDDFAHSYAVTGFKSQGNTLDWVLAKLSKFMDAHSLYVNLTRHRDDVSMYYSKEDFRDFKALVHSFGRVNVKDLVVDYSISDENKEPWLNVQSYKEVGRELQGLRILARSLDKEDKDEINAVWENHRLVEADRKNRAKLILSDRDWHRDFVRQAGLTFESIEIAAGLKKRATSSVEVQAQLVVEQYVSYALEARELWRNIRRTHPGVRAKSHPEWNKFVEACDQRGILANQIHLKPILHQPFLKETADSLNQQPTRYVSKNSQKVSYSMYTIKVQAEAHQSKILQRELLKDHAEGRPPANPAEQDKLKVLIAYIEARDLFGQMWRETKPKLDELKGSLLQDSLSKEVSECTKMGAVRDSYAVKIVEAQEDFEALAHKVGIKLNFERLAEEAARGRVKNLIKTYKSSPELTAKLEASFEINSLMKGESELKNKPTLSEVFRQGLLPRDIARDALEYQKMKVFEGLKTEPERALFLLLDEYDAKCRAANQLYSLCAADVKGKEDARPWHSAHYGDYKIACEARNALSLEVFDQRDYNQILSMAEAMGIRFKDVELQEIFSRCEQATRTRHITSYLKAEAPESQGESAITIKKMIAFERNQNKDKTSVTAQQAYHSGIDFKELQTTAFQYGRECALKNLSSPEEVNLFHTLESYENTSRSAKKMYGECIEESKQKTTKSLEVKPWETDKFKEYILLVTVQDELAHQLIKGHKASSVAKVAKEMGISVKGIDVDAHRHSLRQTLQSFTQGDPTNVPMAAKELLNWLEFDRDTNHKHTFKILREQDIWPKDVQDSLQGFVDKKREWRHEAQRDLKTSAKAGTQTQNSSKPEYKIITYERGLTYQEVNSQLTERIYELATSILGQPNRGSRNSNYLRFGKLDEFSVAIRGDKKGAYMNFVSWFKGGPIQLIQDQMGFPDAKGAIKYGMDWLGGNVIEQRIVEKTPTRKESTWTSIIPIPSSVEFPDISGDKYLNYVFNDGSKEISRHLYRDEQGNLKGYVVRFEKPNPEDPNGKPKKAPLPLSYWKNDQKGFEAWRWKGFVGDGPKTPYGIEKLAQDQAKPILVVEGEKTCDVAQKLFPEYNVLTWIGGAASVGLTEWKALVGKDVTIWPDYDYDGGGQKAGEKLKEIITKLNIDTGKEGRVGVVKLPSYIPDKPTLLADGWDLADKLPKGWTIDTVKEMIKEAIPDKTLEKVAAPLGKTLTPERTSQEKEALSYLQTEINPKKHSWLREEHSKNLLNAAEDDPIQTLTRWQKISGDYSFKPAVPEIPLTKEQQEALKFQAKDIRAYLQDEINPEKHSWLRENHSQRLLELTAENPLDALKEWQELSGDYSFKPLMPEALMSKEQLAFKETIMTYLKENVLPEKNAIVDEEYCDKLFKIMDRDPLKSLQEWQKDSRDYSFNPFKEQLNDREIRIQEYIIQKILDEDRPFSKQKYADVTANLLDKPLEAYQTLQLYMSDKTFDPSTGIPKIEMEAQELVSKIKDFTNVDLIKGLEERLNASPESVINECNALILKHEKDNQLESTVNKFVTLTEKLDKMAWHDPAHDETFHELSSLVEKNIKNREFIRMVEVSKSSVAIEKLNNEIEERQQQQHTLSR